MPLRDPAASATFALVFAFLLGGNIGSFLNVVAHRVPLGLSVVRPRSRCPVCRTPVRAVDNIPVLSWLLLRGRCRGCKGNISWRYPAVEALTGLLAAYIVYAIVLRAAAPGGDPAPWIHAGAVFVVTATMLAAALIDIDHRILPDAITIPGMWAAPFLAALVPELTLGVAREVPAWLPAALAHPRLAAAVLSVAGIAVGAGVVWSLGVVGSRVFGKEAMGFGDVKYLGMIGGCTGPVLVVLALVIAAFAGSVVGFVRLLWTRDRYIPFGPFLAIGGFVVMVHGGAIVRWYLAQFLGG